MSRLGRLSFSEQLRRARPTVDSPTYRVLTGAITEVEYRRELAAVEADVLRRLDEVAGKRLRAYIFELQGEPLFESVDEPPAPSQETP